MYNFENLKTASNDLNQNGLILWVWHADKIPPHLGLSFNGFYFSLKVSGLDYGVPMNLIFRTIERKKIPTVAIEFELEVSLTDIETIFSRYEYASSNESTCLEPIKNVFSSPEVTNLAEFLKFNEVNIRDTFGFHLPEDYVGIRNYGIIEIQNRLAQLENGKRKECHS